MLSPFVYCLAIMLYHTSPLMNTVHTDIAMSAVVLNRMTDPHGRWPRDNCGVVFDVVEAETETRPQICAFKFMCDDIEDTMIDPKRKKEKLTYAAALLSQPWQDPTFGATHFFESGKTPPVTLKGRFDFRLELDGFTYYRLVPFKKSDT